MGADATEANAARPGSEVLTEFEPGNPSLNSGLGNLSPLNSGNTGENCFGLSSLVGERVAEGSADGES